MYDKFVSRMFFNSAKHPDVKIGFLLAILSIIVFVGSRSIIERVQKRCPRILNNNYTQIFVIYGAVYLAFHDIERTLMYGSGIIALFLLLEWIDDLDHKTCQLLPVPPPTATET